MVRGTTLITQKESLNPDLSRMDRLGILLTQG